MELIDRNKINGSYTHLHVTGGGGSFVSTRALGRYSQSLDGFHWLEYHIAGNCTITSSLTITIAGITFKTGILQASYCVNAAGSDAGSGYVSGGNQISGTNTSASSSWAFAGILEIDSAPTWA